MNIFDISLGTDFLWVRRGVTIPTKAKEMGAKTFIHYSFSQHIFLKAKYREEMP